MKISIGGIAISISNFSITMGIGKGYNTCSIQGINLIGAVGDEIEIIIKSTLYRFIVFEKTYGKNNQVSISGRGKPALLENQIYGNTFFGNFSNSDELINAYKLNINVVNNLPTIDFKGQTYIKDGTPMSKILDMVSVVRGEAYEYNNNLVLDTFRVIGENESALAVDDICFDYTYSDTLSITNKVKRVFINYEDSDVYSETNIDFSNSNTNGRLIFNPSLSSNIAYVVNGLSVGAPRFIMQTETFTLSDEYFIKTLGGIDEIVYITLNGEVFTDYTLHTPTNVLELNYKVSGHLEIKYKTTGLFVDSLVSGLYSVTYDCKILEDYLDINSKNTSSSCIKKLVDSLTVNNGGEFYFSVGADITFIFFEDKGIGNIINLGTQQLAGGGNLTTSYRYATAKWNNISFMQYITSSLKTDIYTTSNEVYYDDTVGDYVIILEGDVASINSVYYGSSEITNYIYSNNKLVFDSSYDGMNLEVSYNVNVVSVVIPPILNPHEVKYLDVIACDSINTFNIASSTNTDMLCSIPATFDVDIAGSFGLSVSAVQGIVVTSSKLGDFTVDNRGKIIVTITAQDEYIIDCSNIIDRAEIYIDSKGVKYA